MSVVQASSTQISIQTSIQNGRYDVAVRCTDSENQQSVATVPIWAIKPTANPVVSTPLNLTITDSYPVTLTPTSLKAAANAGEDPLFLLYTVTSPVGASITKDGTPVTSFTQADINDGKVAVIPNKLTAVRQRADGTLPFTVALTYGPYQARFTTTFTLNLNIQFDFCPLIDPAAVPTISTILNSPVLVTNTVLGLTEPHQLGLQDMNWTSPDIASLQGALGSFEWWCPDTYCSDSAGAGPKWIAFPPGVDSFRIPHVGDSCTYILSFWPH